MSFTVKDLEKIIKESNYIVFFGGAGVSTASGLKDFRSTDGLYNQYYQGYRPEQILSHQFFYEQTSLFYRYYRDTFLKQRIMPNDAHHFLAKLEQLGKLKAVITQNIDGLHQMAKSRKVIELHGSIYRYYTVNTNKLIEGIDVVKHCLDIPYVDGELIKPDVVLYGESLSDAVVKDAIKHLMAADCLIVGGTSLTVYPAAQMIHYFKGKHLVAINKEKLNISKFIQGDIALIFKQLSDLF